MFQSCVQLYVHVVFATKNRLPLISDKLEIRLYRYLSDLVQKKKSSIIKINGTSDHLHLLLKLHGDIGISPLMRELKACNTLFMKDLGVSEFQWQNGFGSFSCSFTHLNALIHYIENQKEHHRHRTFDEEIERLTSIWQVEWMMDGDGRRA